MDIFPNISKVFADMLLKQPFLVNLWFFVFFLVFLVLLLKLCFRLTDFKYKFSDRIFSEAERSFFLVLKQSLAHEYEIFVKVRIADILAPDHPLNRRMQNSAFFKISSKHFDYVLCDK